jgi:hypothetical protein
VVTFRTYRSIAAYIRRNGAPGVNAPDSTVHRYYLKWAFLRAWFTDYGSAPAHPYSGDPISIQTSLWFTIGKKAWGYGETGEWARTMNLEITIAGQTFASENGEITLHPPAAAAEIRFQNREHIPMRARITALFSDHSAQLFLFGIPTVPGFLSPEPPPESYAPPIGADRSCSIELASGAPIEMLYYQTLPGPPDAGIARKLYGRPEWEAQK